MSLLLTLLGLLLVSTLPRGVEAQIALPTAPLTLSLSPKYPKPYGSTALSITSNTLDLANTTITVFVGGEKIYSGNAVPLAITVGGPGQTTSVRVTAVSAGQSYSATLAIVPQEVSLIVEPASSAPALYKGKPLVPVAGSVRLVALADLRAGGNRLSANSLAYTWRQDGNIMESASGIGKSAVSIPVPLPYRSTKIQVTAANGSGSVVGSDSVTLSPGNPVLRIYQDDPLAGIRFERALAGNYSLSGSEVSFIAVPYSFGLVAAPAIHWTLDGATAEEGGEITLTPSGAGRGSSALTATASGSSALESAAAALTLIFGGSSTSIFGL